LVQAMMFSEVVRCWPAGSAWACGVSVGLRGRRGPAALVHFVRPSQVVRPRLLPRHALDQVLQATPEPQPLQRIVEPPWEETPAMIIRTELLLSSSHHTANKQPHTCGDAEVGFVWGDVVDAVVLARQDDVAALQEHHPAGQAEVRVRPLVDLVGEGHEDGERKHVAVPGVVVVHLRCKRDDPERDRTFLQRCNKR